MAKINFPKKQEQRLIPKYLLEYAEELQENHPDPSAEWGESGSTYTAGEGIIIEDDTISVDNEDVAMVSNLSTVAFSGSYNDLSNKPTIPTAVSQLTNDSGYITGIDSTDVINALGYTPGTSNFSGSYNDLTNKPTIPTATSQLNNDSGFITSSDLPTNHVTTNTAQDITGYKTFSSPIRVVNAFKGIQILSGSNNSTSSRLGFTLYNGDLNYSSYECGFLEGNTSNKTLMLGFYNNTGRTSTYYNNWKIGFAYYGYYGTTTDSYSAYKLVLPNKYNLKNYNTLRYFPIDFTNGTTTVRADETGIVNISSLLPTIPTATSDLTNDSGFITGITSSDITTALGYTPGTSNFSGSYNDLTNKPSIPTQTSDLTNNSGFITNSVNNLTNYTLTSNLAAVATSGDYNDLINTPTVPTKTSDLTNDSGFITSSALSGYATETYVDDAINDLTIPTTATSTSTVTPSTATVVNGVTYTPSTETLTFTYDDDTTATVTFLTSSTSVTSSTTTVMTGATVSTTTTLS